MDIDEISEFLFARAGENDLMVTFHQGLFLYCFKPDSALNSEKKIIS